MADDTEALPFFCQPHELEAMDRDSFAFAFQLANSAGSLAMPVENPGQYKINLVNEKEGTEQMFSFTDHPVNRALFSAKGHFGSDRKAFFNFSIRFFAMFKIMQSKEVERWQKPDESDDRMTLLHPAVIFAAAEVPLDPKAEFDLHDFFKAVERIAPECDDE